jgi:archaellum component FlaG (FlaF/FlaG flagellin family)
MSVSSPVPPPPGTPQAPKKGLSPLAWVGIGCAVLFVLGLLVLGGVVGVGGYFAKKVANKLEKHPTLTAFEFMVRANPDLELVNSDEKTNSLTIKNKQTGEVDTISADETTHTLTVKNEKTGETSTMSVDDAKAGKFTFKSDKGTATFDANSKDGGSLKVTDDKGQVTTMNAGLGAPQNLPSWLPVYPGGKIQGTFDTTNAEGHSAAFTVSTSDSVAKMMEFYESQLKSAGLKVEKTTFSANGQDGGSVTGKSSDDKRQANVLFGSANGQTTATVTFQEKK